MAGLRSGSGTICAPLSVRGHDFYKTPPEALYALLENFKVPSKVIEPACGDGAIVNILRDEGHSVQAYDLIDRGCPDSFSGVDFLAQTEPVPGIECCLTNPPYKDAEAFVRKARELYPMTIMLLRLAFLESVRRTDILDSGDLAWVMPFAKRLPFMNREGFTGKRNSNSAMPFAWFGWRKDHEGPPIIKRISWKPLSKPLPQIILTKAIDLLPPTPIEAFIAANTVVN